MSKSGSNFASQKGLTLIEVLIASLILALIGYRSYQTLDVATRTKEVVEDNLAKLSRVDRAWMLIESDLRNVLNYPVKQNLGPGSGDEIPAVVMENGGEYWMTLLRGGHANPLNFVRTEVIRVGYRIQEETLWRDVWYNTSSVDVEQARQQKIIDNVENIEVRILPAAANSFTSGPWVDRWPQQQDSREMPLAIEVKLKLNEQAEIARVYSLVKGE